MIAIVIYLESVITLLCNVHFLCIDLIWNIILSMVALSIFLDSVITTIAKSVGQKSDVTKPFVSQCMANSLKRPSKSNM